jgi:tetratricopeptide (TPR) repeat protein
VFILAAALTPLALGAPANEATDAMGSPQEEEANKAMWAIKPAELPEIVKQKVAAWLETYPSSRRRREVRSRLVQASVQAGLTAEAVEECMRQGFDLGGSYLGEMVLRDDWVAMASLFEKQGRLDGAAHVRVRTYLRLPYQLENRQQLALAVMALSKAGMHAEVLATGKLALAVLPEAEAGPAMAAVKGSLATVQGKDAAERFETFWRDGSAGQDGGSPLDDVAMPGRERLREVAEQALTTKGVLMDKPDVVAMQKGVLHLFVGDLPQAARELQEAVALAPRDKKDAAADQAGMYFRWLDGSAARARQYQAYARYGKAGADGTAGTADDLVNPFVEAAGPRQVAR